MPEPSLELTTTNLTQSKISSYKRGIPWDTLSDTFQQAIDFTRRLGMNFIWIDSLCIIQDDNSDKDSQIALMETIFEQAHLTIAATRCRDAKEGLYSKLRQVSLGPRGRFRRKCVGDTSPRRDPDPANKLQARPFVHHFSRSIGADHYKPDTFPLLDRAWVFQEWTLSQRVLHFTEQELVWECRSGSACECSRTGQSNKEYFHSKLRAGRDLETWQTLVSIFSELELTYPSDRLRALSGLAKIVQPYKRGRYLAGMWESSLGNDLTWYAKAPTPVLETYRAPSWSWAATEGIRVFFWFKDGDNRDLDLYLDVLAVETVLAGSDPTGNVLSGFLKVEGKLLSHEIEGNGPTKKYKKYRVDHIDAENEENRLESELSLLYVASTVRKLKHGEHAFLPLRCTDQARDHFERVGFFAFRARKDPGIGPRLEAMRPRTITIF